MPRLCGFLLVADEPMQLLPQVLWYFMEVVGGFGVLGSLSNDDFLGFAAEHGIAAGYQLAAFQDLPHGAPPPLPLVVRKIGRVSMRGWRVTGRGSSVLHLIIDDYFPNGFRKGEREP